MFGKIDVTFCLSRGRGGGRPICGEEAEFIASLAFAFMAFIADEALQKICMAGKEDETSPLLLEFIVYVLLVFIIAFFAFSDSFGKL